MGWSLIRVWSVHIDKFFIARACHHRSLERDTKVHVARLAMSKIYFPMNMVPDLGAKKTISTERYIRLISLDSKYEIFQKWFTLWWHQRLIQYILNQNPPQNHQLNIFLYSKKDTMLHLPLNQDFLLFCFQNRKLYNNNVVVFNDQ